LFDSPILFGAESTIFQYELKEKRYFRNDWPWREVIFKHLCSESHRNLNFSCRFGEFLHYFNQLWLTPRESRGNEFRPSENNNCQSLYKTLIMN
jgi:hypothetical protein